MRKALRSHWFCSDDICSHCRGDRSGISTNIAKNIKKTAVVVDIINVATVGGGGGGGGGGGEIQIVLKPSVVRV